MTRPLSGAQRRHAKISYHKDGRSKGVDLRPEHGAIRESRTLFPKSRVSAPDSPRLLVSGFNSRKIGKRVTKGAWAGMPIYTLTLEERATCPRSCEQWSACYGNNMPFARRHILDDDLARLLHAELRGKAEKHPRGFVVRAHVLGDFGSPDTPDLALRYVAMWDKALRTLPELRMFSYTAHDPASAIGRAIDGLNTRYLDRCRVRFSGRDMAGRGAVVIGSLAESQHVVCPAQTGLTDSCATCALCWSMDKTIEFLKH